MQTKTDIGTALLLFVLAWCGGCGNSHDPVGDPEASFGAFAQSLYGELHREPLGDSLDVEIGLFGDLNVMAEENVVMGRYRYRIDSTDGSPKGYLFFFVRQAGGVRAVPVVMAFDRVDATWRLSEATYAPAREDPEEGAATFRLEEALAQGLDEWTRNAASGASRN